MSNVRYIWARSDARNIYSSMDFTKETKIELPDDYRNKIFVNILEVAKGSCYTYYKVKLFYADGRTFEGWIYDGLMPIKLFNQEELFDSRFNA